MTTIRSIAVTGVLACSMVLTSSIVNGQSKTIAGEMVATTVTIEAIEQSTRTLTVKDDKGIYETIQAGPDVTRFSELKVGDRITVRYYNNVVVRVKKPGESAVDVDSAALTRAQGQRPGGTVAAQTTITVTITAMDPEASSITVRGPNGYTYSRAVENKKTFSQVKVGDQLEMTWTEALLISVDPPKK